MFSHIARMTPSGGLRSWEIDMLHKPPPRKPEEEPSVFHIGLSVGQGTQPTGIAILKKEKPPGRDPAKYTCRYLRRWPPDTTYPTLLAELYGMLNDATLGKVTLIVEAGPSIKAVLTMLRRLRLPVSLKAVEVRTSAEDHYVDGIWKLAKGTVIEVARQVLQEKRLTFDEQMPPEVAATTPPAQTIYHALATYPFNQTPGANEAFAARDGEYDDLVFAVALACWYGERGQRTLNIWC